MKLLFDQNISFRILKIKDFFCKMQQEQTYKLSDAERLILEKREAKYQKSKELISNEDVGSSNKSGE